VRHTPPTETFSRRLDLTVGGTPIELHELGPAHTRGDLVVHVPSAKTVFTGDIVFNGGHPIIWAGPIGNWINACELMMSWDLDVVVPGHGALTDKAGIREFRDYLAYVRGESKKCFDKGMSFIEAADAISLDPWAHYAEDERMYINVYACYRELGAKPPEEKPDILRMLELMGQKHFRKQRH
jgi:cyclase